MCAHTHARLDMASTLRVVAWGQQPRRSATPTPPSSSRATTQKKQKRTLSKKTKGEEEEAEKTPRKSFDWKLSRRREWLSRCARAMSLVVALPAAKNNNNDVARAGALFDRMQSNATAGTSFTTLEKDSSSLEYKLKHKKLFEKRVMNKSRPGAMKYPLFLLGEWEQKVSFSGYEFPSDEYIDRDTLERAATCPGFQKLSVAYLPDVGKTPAPKYRSRFVHERPGENIDDARRDVVEDRAFNLRNIFNAYIEDETAVESVDYDFSKNPNRATVTLRRGAANNAERVELFTNARESETSGKDGSFLCAETVRQVSLGYSVDYNSARVVNYDYEHVWRYQPMKDDKITPLDITKGDSMEDIRRCNFVRAQLYTIGYLQPDDAMRATARVNQAGMAPIPSLFDAGTAAYAPAVIYAHDVFMERVGCVP